LADGTGTITPPPGYTLETQQPAASSGVTPPPGYTIEGQPPATASTAQPVSVFPGSAPGGNMYPGAPLSANATADISGPGAMNAIGRGITQFGNDMWDKLTSTIQHPVDTAEGVLKASPAGQAYDAIKNSVAGYRAYENARSTGADVPTALKAASDTIEKQTAQAQAVKQAVEAFKKDPGATSVRALAHIATAAALAYAGGAAIDAAPEIAGGEEAAAGGEAAASTAAKPGLVQQVVKGEKVAQAPAQSAMREGAAASAKDAGVEAPATTSQPMRTVLDKPIKDLAVKERGTYDAINEAAGVDLKDLYDHASDVAEALDDPVNIVNRDKLQADLVRTNMRIGQAEDKAAEAGIPPDALQKAKAMTQQRYAMQTFKQKVFNNESVVSGNMEHGAPETINVDSAIKQVENLDKPSKYAPEGSPSRLVQALGDKGAKALKQGLYDAQKAGETALNRQKLAKWLGGGAVAGAGTLYELLKGSK